MAKKEKKNSKNIKGKYYTDMDCIACDSCSALAPENFSMAADNLSYVSKQPENEEEEKKVKEALSACPVGAIGDDGNH